MADKLEDLPLDDGLEDLPLDEAWEDLPLENEEQQKIASRPQSLVERAGRAGLETLGKASRAVDSVTGAPVRAGVSAAIKGENPFKAGYEAFGRDPAKSPTGKDIAAQLGLSTEETIKSPLTLNPWDDKANMLSPAGIAGGLGEAALDPLTYVPGVAVAKGAKYGIGQAGKVAPKVTNYLRGIAEDRAVKAGTGQSIKAIRDVARSSGKGAIDIDKAEKNLRQVGRQMLTPDETGKPVVGWTSDVKDIARNTADRKERIGSKMGELRKNIDEIEPGGAVSGWDIAKDLQDNVIPKIPKTEAGKALRTRVQKEIDNLKDMGNLTFEEAQRLKNSFQYKPEAADALISNQDITNDIYNSIGRSMEKGVEGAANFPGINQSLMKQYPDLKKQYGAMSQMSKASSDRAMKDLSNRFVSPSDYGAGGMGAVTSLATGSTGPGAMVAGAAASGANKLARERGSAFAARSLDAVANAVEKNANRLGKYGPRLTNALAKGGNAGLSIEHRLLLNNDPQYVKIMQELERQDREKK